MYCALSLKRLIIDILGLYPWLSSDFTLQGEGETYLLFRSLLISSWTEINGFQKINPVFKGTPFRKRLNDFLKKFKVFSWYCFTILYDIFGWRGRNFRPSDWSSAFEWILVTREGRARLLYVGGIHELNKHSIREVVKFNKKRRAQITQKYGCRNLWSLSTRWFSLGLSFARRKRV